MKQAFYGVGVLGGSYSVQCFIDTWGLAISDPISLGGPTTLINQGKTI